jgi:hypothetical protein
VKKAFLILLTCMVSYLTFEFWAQMRFGLQNPTLPFGLRKNMGVNLYDAHRLSPNFYGHSIKKGIAYKTDEHGFSINPKVQLEFEQKILIGGDSRAFSLFLNWEDSLAGQLEIAGQGVYLQAFPGCAPALFNHDLFDLKKIHALNPKPERIYYIYDRNDVFGDKQFAQELKNPLPWYAPRRIKLALGGYFWNMINIKAQSFLSKASIEKPRNTQEERIAQNQSKAESEKPQGSRQETFLVDRATLNRMQRECHTQQIPLVMVYIPRFAELISQQPFVRDDLQDWCQSVSVDFIDLYEPLKKICDKKLETIRPYFLDLEEGIHFSPKGMSVIAEAILQYEEQHP